MSKKLPFFKFDAESWLSGKIHILPVSEIGIYINLVALIWRDGGQIRNDRFLHRFLGVEKDDFENALTDFKDLEILYEDGGFLRIKFIDEQLQARADFIAGCSVGGKNSAKTREKSNVPASNLEDTLNVPASNPQGNSKVDPSNKKEDRRKKIEDKERENNAPAGINLDSTLGKELADSFRQWLSVWQDVHGDGRPMPVYTQQAQIARLLRLPEDIRLEAVQKAIGGCWKQIQDIRKDSRVTAAGKQNRQTGTLTEEPQYSNNERGTKR